MQTFRAIISIFTVFHFYPVGATAQVVGTPPFAFSQVHQAGDLVLELDAARSTISGVSPYSNGCAVGTLSWYNLASSTSVSLTGFSGCGSGSGWNGDGTTSVSGTTGPYRISFDGSNDLVQTGIDPSQTFGQNFTISAWIRPTTSGNYRGVAGAHIDSFHGMQFMQSQSGAWYSGYGNGLSWATAVSTVLTLDAWTHVAVVYASGAYLKQYIHGALVQTQNQTISISHYNTFWIGRAYVGSERFFAGDIATFKIYKRILTDAEIALDCNRYLSRFSGATCQ